MKLTETELLDICNRVREAGGVGQLTALKPGIRRDPRSCLIANNLNFDCVVQIIADGTSGEGPTIWGMCSNDERLVQVARSMGWPLQRDYPSARPGFVYRYTSFTEYKYVAELPESLRDSAIAFDSGEYPGLTVNPRPPTRV